MKIHFLNFKAIFALTVSAILSIFSQSSAATLTWDANGATALQTDGLGVWLTANQWWNGSSNVSWTSGDDAVFGNGGTGGAVTLASGTTVGSITFNSFSGTYTIGTAGQTITLNNGITMNSGAGAATIISPITLGGAQSWTNNDDSLLTIGTGAVTNAGYLLTIGGTGNTTVSSAIGGSGGLTKSGSGTLTLSGSNSFTGQLTISNGTLSIATINNNNANGALGNSSAFLPVILGSSGNTGTLLYSAASGSSDKSFTLAAGGTGGFNITTALTLSGLINGSGGLSKTGAGTLTLSQNGNEFTGNTVITNGKVALGAQYALWKSAYDTTGSTGAIGLSATGQATPWLGGVAGSVNLATAITGYASITSLTLNPQLGSSVSYGGVIANGAANMTLNKTGHGTQTLTGTNTYSGATTVWAGTLGLAGASGSATSSAFTVRGGTLLLDNSAGTWVNRISDSAALSLGSLTLNSDNGGVAQLETVGATTFAVGGKVTINNGTGAGTTLAMGAVSRSAGAAIDFVGTGGTLGSGASNPNVTAASGLTNTNGILDWATVGGTQWAESNSNSIRAYSGSFTAINSSTNLQNAQVSGSETLSGARVGNSLNLIATATGQSLALGANNLTLGSAAGSAAAILKSGSDAYTISGTGQVRAGSAGAGTELIAHVNGGALTISAPLSTAILGIAKGGTGDLILSGTRAGTLSGAIGIAGGQLEFQGSSTTLSGVITGSGGLTVNLNAGQTLTMGNNSNSYSGPTIVKGGYLASPSFGSQGMPGGLGIIPGTNTSLIGSNLILEGGVFYASYVFSKNLGDGPNQVQIRPGTSGFVNTANSGGAASFALDSGRELVWGSTYFNPTVFVHSTVGNLTLNLGNGFDLNGATRTILVGDATYNANAGGGVSQLGGVIRSSSGTAGLTKTGVGELLLSGASTFNGVVTVSSGKLAFSGNANVASANPLGQSSAAASNLLLASGTTLKYSGGAASTDRSFTINGTSAGDGAFLEASGTGAINFTNTASPAYGTVDQTRTLTLTGSYAAGNNIFAANIADNGTGAVSLSKTGAGLWVLSGNSSYTGPTTLNAGTLSVSAASNLGNTASNLVFNGGALQISNTTNLPNFAALGRTVSFASGQTVGLDVTSGGIFTVDQVLNQGTGGLSKAGAGTLAINSAHSYTGQTTVVNGTLRLDDDGVISAAPLFLNGGTFALNRSATATLGSTLPALIGGTGSLANISASTLVLNAPTFHTGNTTATAGNITLSHASAIQNSALNTTGNGSVTLSGVTTPTFGGLANSGTTRNLADVIDSSYANVTSLTLKPESGSNFTYGGVIANGASDMTLTKIGAGTQVLQGTNTYSGATSIKNGTLSLSGTAGALSNTSGLTLSGGGLTLTSADTTAEDDFDRVNDSASITSNGGTITYTTTTAASTKVFIETLGSLDLVMGQLNLVNTLDKSAGSQTLALSGLTRSGAANTSAITYSNAGGLNLTNDRIRVNGITADTAADQIIGAWATVGTAANAQTDYAMYDSDGTNGFVVARNIAGSAETTWTTAANAYTMSANQALTATRTITALRSATGAGGTLTLATGANLETYGLLSGAQTLAVNVGTGGVLTTPTGGGNLYITTGGNTISITAPINDNGGAVTLVKSGTSTLTLGGTSNYSGGTVINGGILSTTANNQLGASGGIVVNGTSQWTMGAGTTVSYARSLTVSDGAVLTLSSGNASKTVTGVLSGNGGIIGANSTGYIFSNTGNTFTGTVSNGYQMLFASLGDSSNAINLTGSNSEFQWTGGAKIFSLRPFTLNGTNANGNGTIAGRINNLGSGGLTIEQALAISGPVGARTLVLDGNNTNVFSGALTDGPGSVVTISKSGGGTWNLTNTNSYTGSTSITGGGILTASSLANGGSNSSIGASSNAAGNLILNGGTLRYTGAAASTDRLFSLQASTTIDASGTGAANFTNAGSMGFNGGTAAKTLTLTGSNTGDNTIAAIIGDNTGATTLTKTGVGTWVLAGTNSYSGINTITAGVLGVSTLANGGSNSSLGKSSNAAANLVFGAPTSTLRYTGSSDVTTDRSFTMSSGVGGGATIESSGIGSLSFNNTVALAYGTTNQTRILTLGGTNTGANTFGKVLANNVSGASSLTKTGVGSWVVNQANTYTGTTTVQAGALVAGANAPLSANGAFGNAASALVLGNASTLAGDAPSVLIGGAFTVARAITVGTGAATAYNATLGGSNTSGTSIFSGGITLTDTGSYTTTLQAATGGTVDFQGAFTTNNKAIAIGSSGNTGTVKLTNTISTSGGINVNFGTLLLGSSDRLSDTTPVTVAGGALDLDALTDTVASFNMSSGSLNGSGTLTAATYSLTGGTLNAKLGAGAVTVNGDVTFSAADRLDAVSSLLLQSGTLTLAGDQNVDSFQQTGGTLAGGFSVNSASNYDLQSGTLIGNLGGSSGLNKTGEGTTILSGTNTYTGATNVNAGKLVVNGNISSSSLTSVASGATIGGSGTVGELTVSSGGFINPGNSPGILNVSGDYTQAGLYTAEITGLTAGTEHDQINVTGLVDITGGSLTALFTAGTYAANDLIFILLNDGVDAITGTYSGFAQGATVIEYDGFEWKISYTANSTTQSFTGGNDIALMAIPEPKAALLGGLGLLLLLRRRR